MDFNMYFAELLVRERLRESERLARTSQWIEASRPRSRPLRVAVGLAMLRAGRWVLGNAPDAPALER